MVIFILLAMLGLDGTIAIGQTIFVDTNAPRTNDGSSWENAYIYLQDALAAAQSGDEIRVAQGIYKPDQGAGITPGSRGSSFHLISGVAIYGGFPPGGGSEEERDPNNYKSILDGQLDGTNSYHVVTATDTNSTAILDGFTISGGKANGSYENEDGGGMYGSVGVEIANPTVVNCIFKNNYAEENGGAVAWCRGKFINCAFVGNRADGYGGGANASATFINCSFIGNRVIEACTSCGGNGGGLYLSCSGTLINCSFIGNSAEEDGGAIFHSACGSPKIINCLFSGNSAGGEGGGMYSYWGMASLVNCSFSGNSAVRGGGMRSFNHPSLTNCVLWGNTDNGGMDQSAQIDASTPIVNYCCIQGWSGSLGGIGNIGEDPTYLDPDGDDNLFGTEDDNLRLSPGSPCTDAGNNNDVPLDTFDLDSDGDVNEPLPSDIEGNPRFTDDPHTSDTGNGVPPIIDMGVYEGPHQGFRLSTKSITIDEGATSAFSVALGIIPLGTVEVTAAYKSGDNDITVQSGSLLSFNSSNYWIPQTVTVAAAEDGDYLDGTAIIRVSSPGFISTEVGASEVENDSIPTILYVDASATGGESGTSWADAFSELREALDNQAVFPGAVEEIHIAEGIYKPAEPYGDRQATFQLTIGLKLYGGFPSGGGQRNLGLYETILSGDLNGDDVGYLDDPSRNENSYHVVITSEVDANSILDGFVIIGGNANGSNPDDDGAGLYNSLGTPLVANCVFFDNRARGVGGGIYNNGSSTIRNCFFEDNQADDNGGGLWCSGEPAIDGCEFSFNLAKDNGGGIANGGASIIKNCTFIRNRSYVNGGGISNGNNSNPTITNCSFFGNMADDYGGGFFNPATSHPTLTNCIFSGNVAVIRGGAIDNGYRVNSKTKINNCTFSGNASASGGGIRIHNGEETISNCIFWGNWDNGGMGQSAQICGGGTPEINYCCVQGWTGSLGGIGNISDDPLFKDSDGKDNITGTEDDSLHLLFGSPCIDAGDNTAVHADITDIDGDNNTTEPTPRDLDGNLRFLDEPDTVNTGYGILPIPIVDMGAYEHDGEGISGDFEPDGDVDSDDLAILCKQWLLERLSMDVAPDGGDGIVNFLDWAVFADGWQDITAINDLIVFVNQWLQPSAWCGDIAPAPDGDGIVNMLDFAVPAKNWNAGME